MKFEYLAIGIIQNQVSGAELDWVEEEVLAIHFKADIELEEIQIPLQPLRSNLLHHTVFFVRLNNSLLVSLSHFFFENRYGLNKAKF